MHSTDSCRGIRLSARVDEAIFRQFICDCWKLEVALKCRSQDAALLAASAYDQANKRAGVRAYAWIFTCIVAVAAAAGEISGVPRIVDGDAVQIAATKIRLSGIGAPETDQLCLDAKALRWTCGIASRDELVRHAGDRPFDLPRHWHGSIREIARILRGRRRKHRTVDGSQRPGAIVCALLTPL